MNIISKAIEASGGAQAVASSLNISIQRVVNWRARQSVPKDFLIPLSDLAGVKPQDLLIGRPTDALPPELTKGEAA